MQQAQLQQAQMAHAAQMQAHMGQLAQAQAHAAAVAEAYQAHAVAAYAALQAEAAKSDVEEDEDDSVKEDDETLASCVQRWSRLGEIEPPAPGTATVERFNYRRNLDE